LKSFVLLLIAIMEETGYELDQFALIHPGGAVGQKLNN
jgi:D-arabinose 5-phosphate isomerase GutQ